MERQETDAVGEAFAEARQEALRDAEARHGRAFDGYGDFYLWALQHAPEDLLDAERARVRGWLRRLRGVEDAAAWTEREQQILLNAEAAVMEMRLGHDVLRDSLFEVPRGGQRRMHVAAQLHDPRSPLHRGNPDWKLYA